MHQEQVQIPCEWIGGPSARERTAVEWRGTVGVVLLELSRFSRDALLIGLGAGVCGPSSVGLVCVCVCERERSWRVELSMLWSIS